MSYTKQAVLIKRDSKPFILMASHLWRITVILPFKQLHSSDQTDNEVTRVIKKNLVLNGDSNILIKQMYNASHKHIRVLVLFLVSVYNKASKVYKHVTRDNEEGQT